MTTAILVMDGQPIRINDVLAAGWLGGWIMSDVKAVRERLCAAATAEASDYSISDDDLQTAMDRWRVEANLLAGDEFEAWLLRNDISLEDLAELVALEQLSLQFSDAEGASHEMISMHEIMGEHLLKHLLFDGRVEGLLNIFSRRAVIEPSPVDSEFEAVRKELLKRAGLDGKNEFQTAMAALGLDAQRGGDMLDLEVSYEIFRRRKLSSERMQQELKKRANEMTSFDVEIASFDNVDSAKETLCFVLHEGETLEKAAARADVATETRTLYFDDLNRMPFGARMTSAREGEAFGPFPSETPDEHLVAQLLRRHEPSLKDPAICERLEWVLVGEVVRNLLQNRIRSATAIDQYVKEPAAARELIHA